MRIKESEKASSPRESNPGHLACATNALPLSYDNWTTTSPQNPLYVLHRWYCMPWLHTWQPLSICAVRTQLGENTCWVSKCIGHLVSSWKWRYVCCSSEAEHWVRFLAIAGLFTFLYFCFKTFLVWGRTFRRSYHWPAWWGLWSIC